MDEVRYPILSVKGLSVDFLRDGSYHPATQNVSFDVYRGRTLGVVGESGSGKSVSVMSLMRLLPMPPARITSGHAIYRGSDAAAPVDLLRLSEQEMRAYRGRHMAMIFQEPMTSLNPVQRCGRQVVEMLRLHENLTPDEARRRVLTLFDEVQLPRPEKIFESYPHEVSGGQKQRVMIAMALACNPDILIADEPTTALDVMVQRAILDLLRQVQRQHNIGIIFISHDLGVIAQVADDVAVMYRGYVVESGPASEVLAHPQHPYTQGLLACRPPLDSRPKRLTTVDDYLKVAANGMGQGAQPVAKKKEDASADSSSASLPSPQDDASAAPKPLMQVRNLRVDYTLERSFFGRPRRQLHAVDGVSFDIYRGETLGLVGGSGCGKTTLGRTLMQLVKQSSGDIVYDGRPLNALSQAELRQLRTRLQIIFQDPYSSLNPHATVGDAIAEPLRVHRRLSHAQCRDRVVELMEQVGLSADQYSRYPHEFSGGQRQRVCIARALALEPELVVCDESVSALDVSVQAQVLNLLNELKRQHGFTYLFITHDLAVVKFMADRIMVMQEGKIVESGASDQLFANPQHPYFRQLIDAIPRIDVNGE